MPLGEPTALGASGLWKRRSLGHTSPGGCAAARHKHVANTDGMLMGSCSLLLFAECLSSSHTCVVCV